MSTGTLKNYSLLIFRLPRRAVLSAVHRRYYLVWHWSKDGGVTPHACADEGRGFFGVVGVH